MLHLKSIAEFLFPANALRYTYPLILVVSKTARFYFQRKPTLLRKTSATQFRAPHALVKLFASHTTARRLGHTPLALAVQQNQTHVVAFLRGIGAAE